MPRDMSGNWLPTHQYVPSGGENSCFVCGFDEADQLHQEQKENDLPDKETPDERASHTLEVSTAVSNLVDPDVYRRLRDQYYLPPSIAAQMMTKPDAGKHHFVHPDQVGMTKDMAGWYGSGACAACGQPSDAVTHEGKINLAMIDADGGGGSAGAAPAGDGDTYAQSSAAKDDKAARPHPGFLAETEVINTNKNTPQAAQPHHFQGAEHKQPNGNSRCLLCGKDEPAKGVCNDVPDINGNATVPDLPGKHSIPVMANEDPERALNAVTMVRERTPIPILASPSWLPDTPGFITEVGGKTLVTAQATVDPALFEKAFTPNEFFLWTQGRLVGADAPNRNGAFWTSGDLELGQASVKYGPLNWLHDGKHVIGTLAEGAFTTPAEGAAEGDAAQPHIAVVAPVWKWLFPDEASVIEMASDVGKFWYSMECVSKNVQCVGAGGCGAEAAYLDYVHGRGNTCQHMRQRSATRRFADPTFLGAAVIVPPVRPGWAGANAAIMKQAAALAEKAYDDAGRPAIPAGEWEQLMAQVVSYANA